jgi:hypothetical protein
MLNALLVFMPLIRTKHRRALHSYGSKLQDCEKAARNTENREVVQSRAAAQSRLRKYLHSHFHMTEIAK